MPETVLFADAGLLNENTDGLPPHHSPLYAFQVAWNREHATPTDHIGDHLLLPNSPQAPMPEMTGSLGQDSSGDDSVSSAPAPLRLPLPDLMDDTPDTVVTCVR